MNAAEKSLDTWMGGAWFASGYCGWRSFTSSQIEVIATAWLQDYGKEDTEAQLALHSYMSSDEIRVLKEDEQTSRNIKS